MQTDTQFIHQLLIFIVCTVHCYVISCASPSRLHKAPADPGSHGLQHKPHYTKLKSGHHSNGRFKTHIMGQ